MTAIYIFPIQNAHQPHQLVDNNFMDDEKETNIPQQPQRFWSDHGHIHDDTMHNTSAPMAATSDFVESCTVTHSFANRKRSVVKRRKSVLSSSFTADDEEKVVDIKANSAVLENNEETKEDKLVDDERSDLTFDRGQEEGEEKLESKHVPATQQVDQLDNQQDNLVLHPKDSAIDLRMEKTELTTTEIIITPSRSSSSNSLSSSNSSSSFTADTITPSAPIAPVKKKVSSWSPRKIFSSSSSPDNECKKLSKKSSISSLKQEKFTISSLFSRKKTKTSKEPSIETKETTPFNYTRLPIHTERAIYRLSHIKLANTKRPLRDQVVISNLMFWYLSIVSQPISEKTKPGRIQIKQHKRKIRNHQVKPAVYQSPYSRTSSSSDEEEDDSDDDDELLTSSDEEPSSNKKQDKKKKRKYTLFYKKSKDNNTSWLPSFAMPKQHDVTIRDNEDDIPLAMYQRVKSNST